MADGLIVAINRRPITTNQTLGALDPDEEPVLEFGRVSTFSEYGIDPSKWRCYSYTGALGGRHLMVEAGTGVGKSMA
jgi:Rad3-related DNA helicase